MCLLTVDRAGIWTVYQVSIIATLELTISQATFLFYGIAISISVQKKKSNVTAEQLSNVSQTKCYICTQQYLSLKATHGDSIKMTRMSWGLFYLNESLCQRPKKSENLHSSAFNIPVQFFRSYLFGEVYGKPHLMWTTPPFCSTYNMTNTFTALHPGNESNYQPVTAGGSNLLVTQQ